MKKTIRDIDLDNKKVLVRCDFNVPLDKDFNITDNRRVVSAIPTIQYLLDHNCKVILCSHLGRPKGEVKKEFSMAPVQKELSKLLGQDVKLAEDIIGPSAKKLTEEMQPKDVVLLENVRFDSREEENDSEFAKELASMAEIYVNDAFGTAHRAHASTAGVTDYLPGVSGLLIEKELKYLGDSLNNPKRPFASILGGKKVSDKIEVITSLLDKVDKILIGGGMANTFLLAQGHSVGASVCEPDKVDVAKEILEKANEKNVKIVLPIDNVIAHKDDFAKQLEEGTRNPNTKVVGCDIPDDWQALDIGPESVELYIKELEDVQTVVWNGPVGFSELPEYANGTDSIAKYIASREGTIISVVGGGDSAAAIERLGLSDKYTHISTGGGASLEFLEGKKLPGIECLQDK